MAKDTESQDKPENGEKGEEEEGARALMSVSGGIGLGYFLRRA